MKIYVMGTHCKCLYDGLLNSTTIYVFMEKYEKHQHFFLFKTKKKVPYLEICNLAQISASCPG